MILTMFSSDRQLAKEPNLPSLLSNIANEDTRKKNLMPLQAAKLLVDELSIAMVLRIVWRKGAFKEVLQLGAFLTTIWLILEC
jgi:hypothetical protein